MLSKFIGGFIVIFIGVQIAGMISQQVDLALNCNSTNLNFTFSQSSGATNSFGGGGSEHFGGYDGTISHKSFLSNTAIIQTNQSYFNPECKTIEGFSVTLIQIVPGFFVIASLISVIFIWYNAIKDVTQVGALFNK